MDLTHMTQHRTPDTKSYDISTHDTKQVEATGRHEVTMNAEENIAIGGTGLEHYYVLF